MARRTTSVPDVDYIPGITAENNPRRGGNFRTATPERQDEALRALEAFGPSIPQRLESEAEAHRRAIARPSTPPEKKASSERRIERITHFLESAGSFSTGMGKSTRAISEASQMPIEAARIRSRQEGQLIVPEAGLFYPNKYDMTMEAASSHSRRPEHLISSMLAIPRLSATSSPQAELQGGAGLSFIKTHGHHGTVTFTDDNVKRINSALLAKNTKPAEGDVYDYSKDLIPHSGTHVLSSLSPSVLGALASHHHGEREGFKATTSDWFKGATINAPGSLSDALSDFGNLGMGGWVKGRIAAHAFDNPIETFSSLSTGGSHKIPSYTLNTIKNSDQLYRAGVYHHLGDITHGEAWHREHPDAKSIIEKASKLPHWSDPTATMDVHSGKLSTGLDTSTQEFLGDSIRPPSLFNKNIMASKAPKHPLSTKEAPILQTMPDMGYFIGEEAHNRVARSSHFRSGAGVSTPSEVLQALGWAGRQAQVQGQTLKGLRGATDVSQIIDPNQINQLAPLRTYKA
jgi:hypothetical protein